MAVLQRSEFSRREEKRTELSAQVVKRDGRGPSLRLVG